MSSVSITLTDVTRRFNRKTIFSNINTVLDDAHSYAILGPNGSGKSTLIKVLAGILTPNAGKVTYNLNGVDVAVEDIAGSLAICAPYLELPEELNLQELYEFHVAQRQLGLSLPQLTAELLLDTTTEIRHYSSGMKQRVKLAQCIFSDTTIVLLDEPCTNLDTEGISVYQNLIKDYCTSRLVIVSSNDEVETGFCSEQINMGDYKSK